MRKFPFYRQLDAMDCGPTCLKMIAKHYGKNCSLQYLRDKANITREGVSFLGISDAAESVGFKTVGVRITFGQLKNDAPLPCIVHWDQNHFVVVYRIKNKDIYIADPDKGLLRLKTEDFVKHWIGTRSLEQDVGLSLLMEPTPDFFSQSGDQPKRYSFQYLFKFLKPYKKLVIQLFLGLLLTSVLQLIFPFLTQAVVDVGINNHDIGFIVLVLIAQLIIFISESFIKVIRSWILLHLSTRINVYLISDFLGKLMRLSLGFFDSKHVGDLLQRISDHRRVERFLTETLLKALFSLVNLVVFALVLAIYSWEIVLIFIVGTILYVLWVQLFMAPRRVVDREHLNKRARDQSKIIELIEGVQEIKLNNSELQKRWEWEAVQADLFRVNMKSLSIAQTQSQGASFIIRLTNILITFIAAKAVVEGQITLGVLVAVSYIIGQLSGDVSEMIYFLQMRQDAKLSLERLQDIQQVKEEDEEEGLNAINWGRNCIVIKDLTFQYEGPRSPRVLKNISLQIPEGKTTAIVGESGSGKTTLLKMLLGFYQPVEGGIWIGDIRLKALNKRQWRAHCGTVLQDGYIFSDTIAGNIAVGQSASDNTRLVESAKYARIHDFIMSLPLSYNTKIGQEGMGLSQGQKQRILIARAIYKNPDFLFFDEATNALDTITENEVVGQLNGLFDKKTVVIVAHRLSTIKNADQVVVLDRGEVVEVGTHEQLILKKGKYFNLVSNQLEIGL